MLHTVRAGPEAPPGPYGVGVTPLFPSSDDITVFRSPDDSIARHGNSGTSDP
jgi:hypothetical protein